MNGQQAYDERRLAAAMKQAREDQLKELAPVFVDMLDEGVCKLDFESEEECLNRVFENHSIPLVAKRTGEGVVVVEAKE